MYYSDMPIESSDQDVLNRASFARLLANALIEYKNNETFTVGLFGKWGCGKTSLVNITLSEIDRIQSSNTNKDKELIVVHFNPWNFSSTDQLLTQFFLRLSNEFNDSNKELNKLATALEKYSAALNYLEFIPELGKATRFLSNTALFASKIIKNQEDRDVIKQKEYVIKLLEEQSNHILVVIDDIDRLTNEQIRYVFQLITSVANFPNTTYLLVFDKEIVANALSEVQTGNGEEYLEKIIQMPIAVPQIQKEDLHKFLFDRLESILAHYTDMIFEVHHWQSLFEPCVAPFIKQLRDVNRLYNSLKFKLSAISAEINYVDMIAISVLEIHHPLIYEWVLNNKSLLTGENDISALTARNKKAEDWYKECFATLHELIAREFPATPLIEQQLITETAIKALAEIFPNFGRKIGKTYQVFDMNSLLRNNQIAHPDKFNRYFQLNIDAISTKRSDVTSLINYMSESDIITFLLHKDQKETSYELLENVKSRIDEFTEQRAKIFISALFKSIYKLNQKVQKNLFSVSSGAYAEFMILDLFEKIPEDQRKPFWVDIINNSDSDMIQPIASVLNMIELAYGRLSAEGKKRDFKRIVTEAELFELEKCFLKRAQEMLSTTSLFDLTEWRLVLHLLTSFDPEYTKAYMQKELENDKRILQYLSSFVSEWRGTGHSYEIKSGYEEYLTNERIIKAIMNCKKNGEFFTLSLHVQHKCAAFYLYQSDAALRKKEFEQSDVEDLLSLWQEDASAIC